MELRAAQRRKSQNSSVAAALRMRQVTIGK
jgi:hypothetical protein